jgi:hypothetical protein
MPVNMFNTSLARKFRGPLSRIISVIRRIEQFLGPDEDWVEDDRRKLFEFLDGKFGHAFTMEKSARDYITTAQESPDAVEVALHRAGYQRNLVSTRKYRTHHSGGKQWAVGSYVYDPVDTDWQHHVFLFPAPDGETDVYGHREATVREPVDHVTDGVTPGDPHLRARNALKETNIQYEKRDL